MNSGRIIHTDQSERKANLKTNCGNLPEMELKWSHGGRASSPVQRSAAPEFGPQNLVYLSSRGSGTFRSEGSRPRIYAFCPQRKVPRLRRDDKQKSWGDNRRDHRPARRFGGIL